MGEPSTVKPSGLTWITLYPVRDEIPYAGATIQYSNPGCSPLGGAPKVWVRVPRPEWSSNPPASTCCQRKAFIEKMWCDVSNQEWEFNRQIFNYNLDYNGPYP